MDSADRHIERNTRRKAYEEAVSQLEAAGVSNARRNAEWMLCDVVGCRRAELYAHFERHLSADQLERFGGMVGRRARGEPLQYVLGHTDFYGLRLQVSSDVLIPRPETEQLVEAGLEAIEPRRSPRVLDVGTGSGCIALAIRSERPDASVWACDISVPALSVARANAAANRLDLSFFVADALDPAFAASSPGKLDLLISNPPYISEEESDSLPPEVRDHEPHLALFARDEPLVFYRKLAQHGRRLLDAGGILIVETHAEFGRDAEKLLYEAGYQDVELRRDYSGHPRILLGTRPGIGDADG